jgi:hypothetical protein
MFCKKANRNPDGRAIFARTVATHLRLVFLFREHQRERCFGRAASRQQEWHSKVIRVLDASRSAAFPRAFSNYSHHLPADSRCRIIRCHRAITRLGISEESANRPIKFQLSTCKLLRKVYDESARSLLRTDLALWTGYKIDLMKLACSVGHRACLTAILDFARKILQSDSFSSYVSTDVTAGIRTLITSDVRPLVREATRSSWIAMLARARAHMR